MLYLTKNENKDGKKLKLLFEEFCNWHRNNQLTVLTEANLGKSIALYTES